MSARESVFLWPIAAPAGASEAPRPEVEVVQLFDEMRDRLLRYLLALGLSLHDGEEIVQESFLLLFQHLRQGKSRENLRGWIFRVGRNLALKQRSANQRMVTRTVEFDDRAPEQNMDPGMNPEEALRSKQRQKQLLAVVGALPEQDQSCLYMRGSGLKYREIAQALGLSLGSVAASLARSLAKLERVDGAGA